MTNNLPNETGFFGEFGGRFIPPQLEAILEELKQEFKKEIQDPEFLKELEFYQKNYTGRPSEFYYAKKLSEQLGGAKIYLKREDMNHTGSHKLNNDLVQALLAKRLGKKSIIA